MFNNLSYQQKTVGLIVIAIMLSITAYKRSFKLTINAFTELLEVEEQRHFLNSSHLNIKDLDQELLLLDELIGKKQMAPELVQQGILDFVSHHHNDMIKVHKLREIHTATDAKFKIYSNQLILEGTFNNLLKTIYNFEKQFQYARIVSVNFEKKKDYSSKKTKLFATLIFQNYEKLH